jgi:hypothetical protein
MRSESDSMARLDSIAAQVMRASAAMSALEERQEQRLPRNWENASWEEILQSLPEATPWITPIEVLS